MKLVGRMMPIAFDLCCGKGGWAKGLIAVGWDVVGVDVDGRFRSAYPGRFITGSVVGTSVAYCGRQQVIVSDDGGQFWINRECAIGLVVASPPCQEFSRHDQPWGALPSGILAPSTCGVTCRHSCRSIRDGRVFDRSKLLHRLLRPSAQWCPSTLPGTLARCSTHR